MITRALQDRNDIELVAVNDLTDVATLAHLFKYDSVHGKFGGTIELVDGDMHINGTKVLDLSEPDPSKLPWKELGIDIVLECTGRFRTRETAAKHITAGARKVIISAPGKGIDGTVVVGVNDADLDPATQEIISCGSCTTNCLAPLAKVLHESVGIERGLMTTIHAYTSDQRLLDAPHSDLRRARSAALSIVPTTTGAAVAVTKVLPELVGRLDGMAIRVPTPNVSLVDLVFNASRETTAEEINAIVKAAAEGDLAGILEFTDEPLVSIDLNGNPHSSIFDSTLTRVSGGTMVKVLSWYDNECGFSNRMLDLAAKFAG
jgi:glyceraldehyde 3-phosphate dehydrogenase